MVYVVSGSACGDLISVMVSVHEALSGPLSASERVIGHNACAVVPDLTIPGAHLGYLPMQPTHNTLSGNIRAQSVELLNKHLAAAIDLNSQVKQAHWNVRGPSFIAIHELFDKVSGEVENYSDLIAERAGGLGGTAYRTVQVARNLARHRPSVMVRRNPQRSKKGAQRRILEFRLGRAITARK